MSDASRHPVTAIGKRARQTSARRVRQVMALEWWRVARIIACCHQHDSSEMTCAFRGAWDRSNQPPTHERGSCRPGWLPADDRNANRADVKQNRKGRRALRHTTIGGGARGVQRRQSITLAAVVWLWAWPTGA